MGLFVVPFIMLYLLSISTRNLLEERGYITMEENQILTESTTTNQTVEEVETQQPVVTEEEKTLPQSKVNEIVQKRIEKVNEQWQKKFDALQESIKLQSMNEEQKAEYDYNKKLEELQQREQEPRLWHKSGGRQ